VLSTLRYAADLDYHLIVAHDCCSDSDLDVHQILVEKTFLRAGAVATANAAIAALAG